MNAFEAEIRMIPVAEGGSRSPVYSGWRPLLRHAEMPEGYFYGTEVRLERDQAAPGETTKCVVLFINSAAYWDGAKAGDEFLLCDGPTPRASGRILAKVDNSIYWPPKSP